jgi:sucrose-6-phosphate hydrolase SacC (GH32 family)
MSGIPAFRAMAIGLVTAGAALAAAAGQQSTGVSSPRQEIQRQPPYGEALRPQFHFSPAASFTNDPNGLVFYKGRYHLFYQQRVFRGATGLSCCDWGHAVSTDLVHWEQRPVAIERVPAADGLPEEAIFSGSAVVDWGNTSGFGTTEDPPLVAIYTGARPGAQTQKLAYSVDGGDSWQVYAGNPVLDIGSGSFRDPKVFWYEPLKRWTMVVYSTTGTRFYSSPDLKTWTYRSAFGSGFECPDFLPLAVDGNPERVKWVLYEANGSYWIGDFDGSAFTADTTAAAGRMDYGTNYYAAQTFSDIPGRRILVGWISTGFVRSGIWPELSWMGAMTVARELSLRTVDGRPQVVAKPVPELEALRSGATRVVDRQVQAGATPLPSGMQGNQLDIEVEFEPGSSARSGLRVLAGGGLYTEIGYDAAAHEVYIDRSNAGRQDGIGGNGFSGRAPLPADRRGMPITLRVLVDRSTLEVYVDDGIRVLSANVLPLVNTRTTAPASAGERTLLVETTEGFSEGTTLRVNADANGPGPGMRELRIATVGTGTVDGTLAAPANRGDRNVKLTSVANISQGRTITIGSGELAETITVAPGGVGTAASTPTMLLLDAPAGATNIKVANTAGFAPGAPVWIAADAGAAVAIVAPAGVGTRGRNLTLAASAPPGATSVQLTEVRGLAVGVPIVFDPESASPQIRTIAGPLAEDGTFNGRAGGDVTLSEPLIAGYPAGTTVRYAGTGISLTSPIAVRYAAGTRVSLPGTGVTLTAPLARPHAAGEKVSDPGTGLATVEPLERSWSVGTPVSSAPALGVQLFADGGTATFRSVQAWRMVSIWPRASAGPDGR